MIFCNLSREDHLLCLDIRMAGCPGCDAGPGDRTEHATGTTRWSRPLSISEAIGTEEDTRTDRVWRELDREMGPVQRTIPYGDTERWERDDRTAGPQRPPGVRFPAMGPGDYDNY
jgi:hypothetical protein